MNHLICAPYMIMHIVVLISFILLVTSLWFKTSDTFIIIIIELNWIELSYFIYWNQSVQTWLVKQKEETEHLCL
jgi:hypothetical protein